MKDHLQSRRTDLMTASFSPTRHSKYNPNEFSTADKFENLQNTTRYMQELLQENQMLRSKLEELGGSGSAGRKVRDISGFHHIEEWDLAGRNTFLEQKLVKLKEEKERQSKHLKKMRESEKWQNKQKCTPIDCYYKKYMRLLRVKCPSTSY